MSHIKMFKIEFTYFLIMLFPIMLTGLECSTSNPVFSGDNSRPLFFSHGYFFSFFVSSICFGTHNKTHTWEIGPPVVCKVQGTRLS